MTLDDATLQLIINYVEQYVRDWGRTPTPKQLRAELGVTVPEHKDG